jgi:hypothetical protein
MAENSVPERTGTWRTVHPSARRLLKRNLLYTGVTQGKKLVVLLGQKKAVAIAVRNVSGRPAVVKTEGMAEQSVASVLGAITRH